MSRLRDWFKFTWFHYGTAWLGWIGFVLAGLEVIDRETIDLVSQLIGPRYGLWLSYTVRVAIALGTVKRSFTNRARLPPP